MHLLHPHLPTPTQHTHTPITQSNLLQTNPATQCQLGLQTAGGILTLQTCHHMLHTHLRLNYLYPENTKTEKKESGKVVGVVGGEKTKLSDHSNGWDQEKSEVETTKA